jgi:hypothetical protein
MPVILDENGEVDPDTSAVTYIAGKEVLMEEFILWNALMEGDCITADGRLAGVRTRPLSSKQLNAELERALQTRSMPEELQRLLGQAPVATESKPPGKRGARARRARGRHR